MPRTIDLHHHVIPDFYWEASNEGGNAAGGITPPRWSLDGAIAYLDEAEIDVAVPSISTVHAAQKPAPQPNFVPSRARTSRSTQSSGVCAWRSSTSTSAPFTTSFIGWTFGPAQVSCRHRMPVIAPRT